jgi:hypothetical protein
MDGAAIFDADAQAAASSPKAKAAPMFNPLILY